MVTGKAAQASQGTSTAMTRFLVPSLLALIACAAPSVTHAGTFGLFYSHKPCCDCGCGCFCVRQYNAFSPVACGTIYLDGFLPIGSPGCGPGVINTCGIPNVPAAGALPNGLDCYTSICANAGQQMAPQAGPTDKEPPTQPPSQMPHVEPAPLPQPAPSNVQPTAYQGLNYAPAYNYGMYGYPAPGYGYYVPGMMANPHYTAPGYWSAGR
jgi:hypothetical protein